MPYVRNVLRDPPKTLSDEQQKKILEVTGDHVDGFRDHVIISVALATFLRESELAALNVGDVGQARGKNPPLIKSKIQLQTFKRPPAHRNGKPTQLTKSPSPHHQRVFVPKSVRRKLAKYFSWKKRRGEGLEPGDPLFCSRRGDRLSTRMFRQMFRDWQHIAGFDELFVFHTLRHTGISNFYRATGDLVLTKMQARHADVATTQIYTHLSDHDLERAVEDVDDRGAPTNRQSKSRPRARRRR